MDKTRTCRICGKAKPILDFYKRENGKYRTECIECQKERVKNWYKKTYETRRAVSENYRYRHRKYLLEKQKEYYEKHKESILEKHYSRRRIKKALDPLFSEIEKMRWTLQGISHENWHYNQPRNKKRKQEIEKVLGCTIEEFKIHLLKTWEDTYKKPWTGEKYHIDHIVPLNTANSIQDIEKLCHYTNLRMIAPTDNLTRPKNLKKHKAT